eukprot:scaffold18104_cov120-Amphora_coffeaeformis.AAC.1
MMFFAVKRLNCGTINILQETTIKSCKWFAGRDDSCVRCRTPGHPSIQNSNVALLASCSDDRIRLCQLGSGFIRTNIPDPPLTFVQFFLTKKTTLDVITHTSFGPLSISHSLSASSAFVCMAFSLRRCSFLLMFLTASCQFIDRNLVFERHLFNLLGFARGRIFHLSQRRPESATYDSLPFEQSPRFRHGRASRVNSHCPENV